MAGRLWHIITWPSAIITLFMGASLLINNPAFLSMGFMHVKLTLVFLLYLYHLSLQYIFNQLKKDQVKYSSQQMRIWNEVGTLFLISIVFLIVLKDALSMLWGLLGLFGIMILLMLGIRLYKKLRKDEK